MKKTKYVITFSMILILFLFDFCFSQAVLRLTDEDKIEMGVESIRRGIQKQDAYMILDVCAEQVQIKGNTIQANELKQELELIFAKSSERTTTVGPPSRSGFTDLWDFDIIDLSLVIKSDSARANCKLVFWAAEPLQRIPGRLTGRKIDEEFTFGRTGETWRLVGAVNLLDFLRTYGEIEKMEGGPNKKLKSNLK